MSGQGVVVVLGLYYFLLLEFSTITILRGVLIFKRNILSIQTAKRII